MRPYATVSPLFWTGATGKRLRKDPDAQRVAFYLITSPHSHQSGLYYLPMMYLCHEVGISPEGASKALRSLSEDGFCVYDETSEWIWVKEMAAWQIGQGLQASDKRCKGVQQYLLTVPELPFIAEFIARYGDDFHLYIAPGKGSKSPLEGASSEQNRSGTEQEHNTPEARASGADDKPARAKGTRIAIPFPLTDAMRSWAAEQYPNVDVKAATAEFEDYWVGVPGPKGLKLDWVATWRNRIRDVSLRQKRNGYASQQIAAAPRARAFGT
ncbi:MAG TPA: hypothetical protein VEC57_21065 [Candidatus Limnocylindrales bacterium]|nr:hypothetical protein [Candidatus Limnocylindrales bacterium]